MKIGFFLVISLIFLFQLSTVNAQITLPEFNDAYALGDTIDSSFKISESQAASGLVKLTLQCGESELFFTSPISLKANELKEIKVPEYTLRFEGNCKIIAALEGQDFSDSAESSSFLTSSRLNISLKTNKKSLKPEETLILRGEAVKANGKPVNGVASIKLNKQGYSEAVKNGDFTFETTLEKKFSSGEQIIIVEIKDDGNSNFDSANISITVEAIPTTLEIITNNDSFIPGDTLNAYALLYDQGGEEINTATSLILYDSWGLETKKSMTNGSSEALEYTFDQKAATGEWWLYAYAEGIRIRKFISLEKVSGISAGIKDAMLKIINIGNTEFKKPVEISFINAETAETKIEELSLGISGEKEFLLNAPNGTYNVTIKTENYEKSFDGISLTGNAIRIIDKDGGALNTARNIAAIVIMLAIIAAAIIIKLKRQKPISIRKVSKNDSSI